MVLVSILTTSEAARVVGSSFVGLLQLPYRGIALQDCMRVCCSKLTSQVL